MEGCNGGESDAHEPDSGGDEDDGDDDDEPQCASGENCAKHFLPLSASKSFASQPNPPDPLFGSCGFCLARQALYDFCSIREQRKDEDGGLVHHYLKYRPGTMLARALWSSVNFLEKKRKYQSAIAVIETLLASNWLSRKRGSWWNRLLVDHKHLKTADEDDIMQKIAKEALADPYITEGDKIAVRKRAGISSPEKAEAVQEYRTVSIVGRPMNSIVGRKSKFHDARDGMSCSVEDLVMDHYGLPAEEAEFQIEDGREGSIEGGWTGLHCEGGIMRSLFTLLLWRDVLFADTDEDKDCCVFLSPLQDSPLDLTSPEEEFFAAGRERWRNILRLSDKWTHGFSSKQC